VQQLILNPLAKLRTMVPEVQTSTPASTSRFPPSNGAVRELEARLNLPIHRHISEASTLHSLRYLFCHMRCGIFVAIRRGRLAMFVPFVNNHYHNTWGDQLQLQVAPGQGSVSVEEYYKAKNALMRRHKQEKPMADKTKWWANGNIMCNVEPPRFWNDAYLTQLRHMLEFTCKEHAVPDVEFFVNKRDFPHLKSNVTEPYDFIFSQPDQPLPREKFNHYAPIASFFVSSDRSFADLPLVCTDDWETATGLVFPPGGQDLRSKANRNKNTVPWDKRQSVAVFRGNSTGPGVVPSGNQRLLLAAASQAWNRPGHKYSEDNAIDRQPYLDAGVVGFNIRDRKVMGEPMTFLNARTLKLHLSERVPMYAQSKFKYQIYVDGHCAAMRYLSMIPIGGVILKVGSIIQADAIWYWPLLCPYDFTSNSPDPMGDHIPVKADLSDLADAISWCKRNDEQCQRIAANAQALYDSLINMQGQAEYTAVMLRSIAQRFQPRCLAACETTQAAVQADRGSRSHPASISILRQEVPDELSAPWLIDDGSMCSAAAPSARNRKVFTAAGQELPSIVRRRRKKPRGRLDERSGKGAFASRIKYTYTQRARADKLLQLQRREADTAAAPDTPSSAGGGSEAPPAATSTATEEIVEIADAGPSFLAGCSDVPAVAQVEPGEETARPEACVVTVSLWGMHGVDWFSEANCGYTSHAANEALPGVPLGLPGAATGALQRQAPTPPSRGGAAPLPLDILGADASHFTPVSAAKPSGSGAAGGAFGGGLRRPAAAASGAGMPAGPRVAAGSAKRAEELRAQRIAAVKARLAKQQGGSASAPGGATTSTTSAKAGLAAILARRKKEAQQAQLRAEFEQRVVLSGAGKRQKRARSGPAGGAAASAPKRPRHARGGGLEGRRVRGLRSGEGDSEDDLIAEGEEEEEEEDGEYSGASEHEAVLSEAEDAPVEEEEWSSSEEEEGGGDAGEEGGEGEGAALSSESGSDGDETDQDEDDDDTGIATLLDAGADATLPLPLAAAAASAAQSAALETLASRDATAVEELSADRSRKLQSLQAVTAQAMAAQGGDSSADEYGDMGADDLAM